MHTDSLKIDTLPPTSSVIVTGIVSNGWYTTPVNFTLNASDATSGVHQMLYQIDGGVPQTYSGSFTVSPAGNHTLIYWATDQAGNTESAHTLPFQMDTTAPTTTAVYSGATGTNGWYTGAVTATLSATDTFSGVAEIDYNLDAGGWLVYTNPVLLTGDGSHLLAYRAKDKAGNLEAVHTATFLIDTLPPISTVSAQGTQMNGWYTTPVNFTLNASDATSGVHQMLYQVDSGPSQPYTSSFGVNSAGPHTLTYWATDAAGNIETAHRLPFQIDTTAPLTVGTYTGTLGKNGWYTSSVTATLSATDALSGVAEIDYNLDAGGWTTYTGPILINGEGAHSLVYRATDKAGNVESAHTAALQVDTQPPLLSANLSGMTGANGWYIGSTTLTLTASDATSGLSSLNYDVGSGFQPYTAPIVFKVDGLHPVQVQAVDTAGNTVLQTVAIRIDGTAPVLNGVTCPVSVPPGSIWLAPNVSDATSGVARWQVNVTTAAGATATYTGTGSGTTVGGPSLDKTPHTYTLLFWDAAGNVLQVPNACTVNISVQAPTQNPPPPPPPATQVPTVTFTPRPTFTRFPTATPRPTQTPSATATASSTSTPPLTNTPHPTQTPNLTMTAFVAALSATATPTLTFTPSPTLTASPSLTASATPMASSIATLSSTPPSDQGELFGSRTPLSLVGVLPTQSIGTRLVWASPTPTNTPSPTFAPSGNAILPPLPADNTPPSSSPGDPLSAALLATLVTGAAAQGGLALLAARKRREAALADVNQAIAAEQARRSSAADAFALAEQAAQTQQNLLGLLKQLLYDRVNQGVMGSTLALLILAVAVALPRQQKFEALGSVSGDLSLTMPISVQQSEYGCGVAALHSAFSVQLGADTPNQQDMLAFMQKAGLVDPRGTTLNAMTVTAQQYGYNVQPSTGATEDTIRQALS